MFLGAPWSQKTLDISSHRLLCILPQPKTVRIWCRLSQWPTSQELSKQPPTKLFNPPIIISYKNTPTQQKIKIGWSCPKAALRAQLSLFASGRGDPGLRKVTGKWPCTWRRSRGRQCEAGGPRPRDPLCRRKARRLPSSGYHPPHFFQASFFKTSLLIIQINHTLLCQQRSV